MDRKPHDVPSRRERRSVGRLALVLWIGVCVVLAAVALPALGSAVGGSDAPPAPERAMEAPANATAERTAATERRTERAEGVAERFFPDAEFSFDVDRGTGLDVRLGTGSVDVRFLGLGGGDDRASGTIDHAAIDEGVARSSGAGLCAAGLGEADSPLALDVDAENSSVTAELSSEPAGPRNRTEAVDSSAVVRSCTNSTR